jgi:tight adherence protein B
MAAGMLVGGVLLAAATLRPHRDQPPAGRRSHSPVAGRRDAARLAGAVAAGIAGWTVTGWPVAVVLTAAGVWWLPSMLGPDRRDRQALARTEAVATWAESLRDVLGAAAGLRQAILATGPVAPPAIREPVSALTRRIGTDMPLAEALRRFAVEVADPVADLVAAALVQAADNQARHLGALLGALATTAREHAAARVRIATSRARARTSVRIITATTLVTVVALVVFNRPFLAPYATPAGQLVLLAAGGLFAAGLAWMRRIAVLPDPPRVLAPTVVDDPAHRDIPPWAPQAGGGRR